MFELIPEGIILPRGMLSDIEETIIFNNKVTLIDNRVLVPTSFDFNVKLRDYQQEAVYNALSYSNGLIVSPAGSGKTMIGLSLCSFTNQKTLWLTHTKALANQVYNRLVGPNKVFSNIEEDDIGIIGGGKWSVGKFTISMIPTLVRNLDRLKEISREFGLVIIDECHHVPASTFIKVVECLPSYYMYGLTATPIRRDGLEDVMFPSIGNIVATVSRQRLIDNQYIYPPTVKYRNIRSEIYEGNDYHYIHDDLIIPNKHRSNIIIEDIIREAKEGHYCIVISTRKNYCDLLYESVRDVLGDKVAIAHGDHSDKHVNKIINKLSNKEINVLFSTSFKLGEGFDIPHLTRGFLVLPMRWSGSVEQVAGRLQRPSDNNKVILYDYVDYDISLLLHQFNIRCQTYHNLGMNVIEME